MQTLLDYVDDFKNAERPTSNMMDEDVLMAQAIAATRFYAGYGALSHRGDIDENTPLSLSEWAIIKPLFVLYVEREQAAYLEASRTFGAEVFGRSVSEVSADIAQYQADMPKKAFFAEIMTV